MNILTASTPARPVVRFRRAGAARVALWAVRILLAGQFVVAGVLKVTADPAMVAMFEDIGAGQGLRLVVGLCEVAGGVGVLLPRLARPAAVGLGALMVGAVATNVVALGTSPALPLLLLGVALLVAITSTPRKAVR